MLPYSKQHRPLHNSAVSGSGKPLNDTRNTGIPIATPTAVPPSHGSRRNEPSPQFDLNFNASLLNSKFNDKNGLHKAPSNTATGAETSSKSTQLTVLLSGGPTRRNDTSSPAQKEENSPWHDKPDQHRGDISSDYTRSMQTPTTKKRGLEQTNTTNDYDNDKDNRKNGNKDMGIDRPRKVSVN
ncbi:hypothetical protein BDF22DRAFT_749280 [Syncephalis plumigaleata]|nr:hypothetical protein BDF22DRAFT_749280 [Syncephalis plumigaleata]